MQVLHFLQLLKIMITLELVLFFPFEISLSSSDCKLLIIRDIHHCLILSMIVTYIVGKNLHIDLITSSKARSRLILLH
jgi:hypothetical protein